MVIVSEASENASSDTSNFQITVKELNDLMMARGLEAVEEVQRLGGVEVSGIKNIDYYCILYLNLELIKLTISLHEFHISSHFRIEQIIYIIELTLLYFCQLDLI